MSGSRYLTDEHLPIVDSVTNVSVGISQEHHEVHDGKAYVSFYVDAAMGNTEWIGIGFTTPAGSNKIHLVAQWSTLGKAHAEIIEAPSLSGGVALVAFNRNRSSSNTSVLASTLKYYDSVAGDTSVGGTVINQSYAFTTKNAGSEGGRDVLEFVLNPQTTYIVKATSDAASGAIELGLHWYEQTDAN